jgi:hypothetical protein
MALIEHIVSGDYAVGLYRDHDSWMIGLGDFRNMSSESVLALDSEDREDFARARLQEAGIWIGSADFDAMIEKILATTGAGDPNWDLIVERFQTYAFDDRAALVQQAEIADRIALEQLPTFGLF